MFEKEAEEYAKKKCGRLTPVNKCEWFLAYNSYQEGAVVADFNKANEWHYVKDGDLPKESEGKCFYLLWFGGEDYRIAEYVQGRFSVRWFYVEGVIAWKEIVPPVAKEANK